MPKLEWLFLDLAVEDGVPLGRVWGSPHCFKERWNLPWYGLSREETARTIRDLHARGLIEWLPCSGTSENASLVIPSDADLFRSQHYYGLTPSGGAAWEQIAQPNWMNFLDCQCEYIDDLPVSMTVSGPNQRQLGLGAIAFSTNYYCLPEFSRCAIKGLQPYMPTYWKSLDTGYEMTIDVKRALMEGTSIQQFDDFLSVFDWQAIRSPQWYERHELWKSVISAN